VCVCVCVCVCVRERDEDDTFILFPYGSTQEDDVTASKIEFSQ